MQSASFAGVSRSSMVKLLLRAASLIKRLSTGNRQDGGFTSALRLLPHETVELWRSPKWRIKSAPRLLLAKFNNLETRPTLTRSR